VQNTQRIMKITIVVLSILLAMSLTALAIVFIFGDNRDITAEAIVEDNYIRDQRLCLSHANTVYTPLLTAWFVPPIMSNGDTIELYKNHPDDNTPFDVRNMFPGDREEKSYCVKISYTGKLTVHFKADIREGYKKLAEVLECSVTLRKNNSDGELLYSGLMRDMPESVDTTVENGGRVTEKLYYDIAVWLDTSVGNDYQMKMLIADFIWWADCEPSKPIGPIVPIVTTTDPDITSDDETVTSEPETVTSNDETVTSDDETVTSDDETVTSDDETVTSDDETTITTTETTAPEVTVTAETTGESETTDNIDETTTEITPETGTPDGELISPSTGSRLFVIFTLLGLSFIFAVVIMLAKKKKEDAENEQ